MSLDLKEDEFFTNSGIPMCLCDPDGTILVRNGQFNGLFMSREDPRATIDGVRNVTAICSEDSRSHFLQTLGEARDGNAAIPYVFQLSFVLKGGSQRVADAYITRLPGKDIFLLSFQDVTDRVEAIEVLNRHNSDLTALVKITKLVSSSFDREKILKVALGEAVRLFGMDRGWFMSIKDAGTSVTPVASYGGVELPPGIVERLAMHFLEGSPERFKPTIIEIDGINRLGHNAEEIFRSLGVRLLSITPEIVGGKLTGLLCLASTSDGARFPVERLPLLLTLTHQMGVALENARLYRELLSSQKRYKNLADNIKDIMFALDGHLVITYVNNAITAAMGYASEELVGTNIGALVTGNPLNAPGIEAMRRIIAGGDDGPLLIMECARKDGGTEMVEVMITPVRDGDAHTMFQGIARVITQKLRWEQDMKRRNEEQNMLLSLSTVLAASPQLGTLGDGVSMQRLPASDPRTSLMMVLDEAARLTAEFLHVEIVSVHTVDRESGGLTRLMRYSAPGVDRFTSPGHFDLISWDPDLKDFMGQTRPIAISDLDQRPSNFPMAESLRAGGMRSFIIAPLVHAGLPVGTLSAATVTATREFNESDMNLLVSIASHVALAVLNAQYLEEVTRQKADLELLSNQLITGQEEDRRRIARELHDEAGQSLYALRLSLDMLKGGLKQVGSQGLADMVDEQLKVVSQTIDNIRRITYDLRPALLDDLGLIPALRWYVDNYGKRTGLEVELELVECDFKLEGSAEVNIYRIIQEALTNVYRHAHATRVSVRMVAGAGLLKIEIQDDGRGFSAASKAAGGGGVGLIGIKERITSLGGSLLVYSLQGRGTTLGIEIPLH